LADGRIAIDFKVRHRDLTRVDFYGLGPDSDLADRTSFKLEDTSLDWRVTFRPLRRSLRFGLTGGALLANVGAGNRPNVPSTEQAFSAAHVPGLLSQTDFLRYGGFAVLDTRDNPSLAREGELIEAAFTYYDDRDLAEHDFRKLEIEAQKYIGFFNKRRVIALRARSELNYTNGSQTLPFYMKPTLGGPQELRGFRNYRFYGDNLLVFNAEYRWEAFTGLDMALFFDAGQVAANRADFALNEMESAVGIGFRFNIRNATFMRLDVGFSHEGAKVWIRFGSPFTDPEGRR
jgi:outer membrane protein assembly factor BamA